jgi:formate-dependent nitrite reductase membrane component NrfD
LNFPPPSTTNVRQFAGAWLVFFSALGAHQYFARGHHRLGFVLIVTALVIGIPGLIRPSAIRWLFVTWMLAAFPIGWLVSQIMMALMFYGLVTPVAFIFRLRRRDLLQRKPAPNRSSFWTPKQTPRDIRSHFRQS